MKFRRVFWLVPLLLVLSHSAAAQEGYRLRQPATDEYLQTAARLLTASADSAPDRALTVMETELMLRHPDLEQQPFPLVTHFYEPFIRARVVDEQFWLEIQVLAWLHTEAIELENVEFFSFQNASVHVMPFDVDNDSQDEWLLDVWHHDARGLLVVRRTAEGTYTPIPSPLPVDSLRFTPPLGSALHEPILFDVFYRGDLNADGWPEIVIHYDDPSGSSIGYGGRHYVLRWQDGVLEDIGAESLSYSLPTNPADLEITNLDSDPALELRQIRDVRDNWQCYWQEILTFDWDGQQYSETERTQVFPEDAACYLRFAEEAMSQQNYARAIEAYQTVLEEAVPQFNEYVPPRLSLAYFLAGQPEQGLAVLQNIGVTTPAAVMLNAYAESPTLLSVCLAAYNYMMFSPYHYWNDLYLDVGRVDDAIFYTTGMYFPPPADPIWAGCDAPALIEDLLVTHEFPVVESPVETLTAQGFKVGAEYRTDLNGDGREDWLIWPDTVQILPILFLSEGEQYATSRPEITGGYPLNEENRLYTVQLPGDAGTGLLNVDYSEHYVQINIGIDGAHRRGMDCPGRLSVWRLQDQTLVAALDAPQCDTLEVSALVDDVATGSAISGWVWSDHDRDYVPATYHWEAASGRFELPPDVQAALERSPESAPPTPDYALTQGEPLLLAGKYAEIVSLHDEAVAALDAADPLALYWRYVAGLALEMQGRPEDALAEYVAIVEAAPDSDWGTLAALHLTRGE